MSDSSADPIDELSTGEIVLHGRVVQASNATFVGDIGDVRVVYKPVAGENPLWDFPDGTLAARERAAYVVSRASGWDIVPETILREGPNGWGMVQRWQEPDPAQEPVTIARTGKVRPGYLAVFDGLDSHDRRVTLVHEDTQVLRRMAVFDVVVNNADRKGGHVLAMSGGHRYGVDHGVTFHVENKLRTVLWGWAGEPLTDDERSMLTSLAEACHAELGTALADLLTSVEIEALQARLDGLLTAGRLPDPGESWPVIPWPPF